MEISRRHDLQNYAHYTVNLSANFLLRVHLTWALISYSWENLVLVSLLILSPMDD